MKPDLQEVLKRVVAQFQAFLVVPGNANLIAEDQSDLAQILVSIADLSGDFNHHLKYQSQLQLVANWYYNKYNNYLIDASRESTTCFNLLYTRRRDHGYGEWDAKRFAETDPAWHSSMQKQEQMKKIVNILESLSEACKARLHILQTLSNNYRADLRDEKSTI